MTVKHEVNHILREDGAFGWRCTCGQVSDSPWTKEVADQQMTNHVEEWQAYEEALARAEAIRTNTCGHCKKKLAAKSKVEVGSIAYHRACLKKVLDDS